MTRQALKQHAEGEGTFGFGPTVCVQRVFSSRQSVQSRAAGRWLHAQDGWSGSAPVKGREGVTEESQGF